MKKGIYVFIFCLIVVNVLVGCNGTAETNAGIENPAEVTSDKQTFSVTSGDGSTVIQIAALKDNDQYRIKEINVIKNGVIINSIDDIVGYYTDISLDNQASLAIINYYGRKWSNFILLDIKSGQVVYNEPFNFADVKSAYTDKGYKMDYVINDNDVITFSCDMILDTDTILIGYQVHDMNGNLQSGKFKYVISEHAFDDMQQNSPKPEG